MIAAVFKNFLAGFNGKPKPRVTTSKIVPVSPVKLVHKTPASKNSLLIGKDDFGQNYYIHLDEFSTSGFRFLLVGQSGSGKSYFTGVMLEEFIGKGKRTIIIDPEGEWHTLAESYKGKVKVVGGEFGLSLGVNPDDDKFNGVKSEHIQEIQEIVGRKLEEILTSKGNSLVFDLSEFDDEDQQVIYSIIAKVLFKLEQKYKVPVFLMIDEASIYAPQTEAAKKINGAQSCKKASKKNARRGRKRGIMQGYALQRPANFDKDVLANCTIRFVGKVEEQLDYKALEKMLMPHGISFEHLTNLKAGQFYCIYKGQARLVHIRKRYTEHGGSTPDED